MSLPTFDRAEFARQWASVVASGDVCVLTRDSGRATIRLTRYSGPDGRVSCTSIETPGQMALSMAYVYLGTAQQGYRA